MSEDLLRALKFRVRAWANLHRMPGLHSSVPAFLRLVPKGGVAVDVGAHDGAYTYWLSVRADHVHAFEPRPAAAQAIRCLRIRNATVHELALSDGAGEAELYVPDTYVTRASIEPEVRDGPGRSIRVDRVPLDEIGLQDVRFIKIDVEGHELAVIHGATHTIERDRPVVFCESEERHRRGAVGELVEMMRDRFGYRAHFWWRGEVVPIQRFDLEEHQIQRSSDVRSADYVNNFVFVPGEA